MNCLFKKPGGFFLYVALMMSIYSYAFDKHKLQSAVPSLKNSVLSALSEQEQEFYRACRPDPAPCFTINDKITMIKKDVQNCCDGLDQKIDEIIKVVDSLEFCERVTVIHQTDIPYTITASGNYCLAEDVSTVTPNTAITIDADFVSLDLNGFSISDAEIGVFSINHQNIIIKNGSIKDLSGTGIMLSTCTGASINDINFFNIEILFPFEAAVEFSKVVDFKLNNLSFTNNVGTLPMIFLGSCNNGIISNVNIFRNFIGKGIEIVDSSNINVDTCSYSENSLPNQLGYQINNSNNCNLINCSVSNINVNQLSAFAFEAGSNNCYSFGCKAMNNSATQILDGFFVANDVSGIIIDSCLALENIAPFPGGRGFVLLTITTANACCIINSVAKSNSTLGFTVQDSTNCYIANNIAQDNGTGYDLSGGTNNIFFGNYAHANGTNYNVSTNFAPQFTFDPSTGVFTPVAPRINPVTLWDNIDAM